MRNAAAPCGSVLMVLEQSGGRGWRTEHVKSDKQTKWIAMFPGERRLLPVDEADCSRARQYLMRSPS